MHPIEGKQGRPGLFSILLSHVIITNTISSYHHHQHYPLTSPTLPPNTYQHHPHLLTITNNDTDTIVDIIITTHHPEYHHKESFTFYNSVLCPSQPKHCNHLTTIALTTNFDEIKKLCSTLSLSIQSNRFYPFLAEIYMPEISAGGI